MRWKELKTLSSRKGKSGLLTVWTPNSSLKPIQQNLETSTKRVNNHWSHTQSCNCWNFSTYLHKWGPKIWEPMENLSCKWGSNQNVLQTRSSVNYSRLISLLITVCVFSSGSVIMIGNMASDMSGKVLPNHLRVIWFRLFNEIFTVIQWMFSKLQAPAVHRNRLEILHF